MPTFDFQCRSCSHVFEFTRPFGSTTLPACPACKGKKTEKWITPPPVHFRGSGFYKTDSTTRVEKKTTAKKEPPPPSAPPAPSPSPAPST